MAQHLEFEPWGFFSLWFKRAVLTYLVVSITLAIGFFLCYWGYFLYAEPALGGHWRSPTTLAGWAFAAVLSIIGPLAWIILWLSVVLLLVFPILLVVYIFLRRAYARYSKE